MFFPEFSSWLQYVHDTQSIRPYTQLLVVSFIDSCDSTNKIKDTLTCRNLLRISFGSRLKHGTQFQQFKAMLRDAQGVTLTCDKCCAWFDAHKILASHNVARLNLPEVELWMFLFSGTRVFAAMIILRNAYTHITQLVIGSYHRI